MSPLEGFIRRLIVQNGPMSVAQYMGLALGHPEYGYYKTRDPMGRGGDFTTAPEISQMFGEMIGAWLTHVWQEQGGGKVNLVELGPGRGTMMADILRVSPGLREHAVIHLIESSSILREVQAKTLSAYNPLWHESIEELPEGKALFVMNEFFDALPIRQFIAIEGGAAERSVGIDPESDALCFTLGRTMPGVLRGVEAGKLLESCPAAIAITTDISRRLKEQGGAALIVDYGYIGPASGDTLQAVKHHAYTDPLHHPGDCDLTAHVDFGAVAEAARNAGIVVHGPVEQGLFLETLGIVQRAAKLKEAGGVEIDAALQRLTAQDEMGTLFKVMALTAEDMPLPGFVA